MRADDFDIPAGQSFRKLRDFLRAKREIFTPKAVVQHFGIDITNELQAKGLIEPYVSPSGETISPDWFQVSPLGLRLANVRLIPRISRAKAEKIVADMLARARIINDTPELLFWISKITVFGSFITDAKDVGDIDLFVEMKAKMGEPGKDRLGRDWTVALLERARNSDQQFSTYSQELDYAEVEVARLLKNRNPYLAFMKEVDSLDTAKRVIFSDETEC
jgi:hypothetical protein